MDCRDPEVRAKPIHTDPPLKGRVGGYGSGSPAARISKERFIITTEEARMSTQNGNDLQGIHVVAKPAGPACNLNCEYCFYLEKQALFGKDEKYRISDDVLRAFIMNYITSQPTPVVPFVWQGGEPTLLGVDFFKRVVELQKPL